MPFWTLYKFPEVSKPNTKVQNMNNSEQKPQSCQTRVTGSFKSRFFNKPQELDIEFIKKNLDVMRKASKYVNGGCRNCH